MEKATSFPFIRFGVCPECGADGRDQTEDLTSADAPARDLTGNGIRLILHKGKVTCNVCANESDANQESIANAKKHAESEKFRDKAGFINSVEDD